MKDSYKHLVARSREHLSKGEVGMSINVLREALELEPDDAFLWEEIYKLCMLAGSPKNALVAAFELRRIAPNDANFVYMHGIASLIDGQVNEACTILEDALRRLPGSNDVRRALAQAYGILEKHERAQELLEDAVEQAPTDPSVVNDLVVHLMEQHGAEGKRRAEPLLRRVLELHPKDEAANLNLALVLMDRDAAAARQHASVAKGAEDESIREQAQRLLQMLQSA